MPWQPIEFNRREWRQIDDKLRAFRKKPRFLIDENVSPDVASVLREKGYNVHTVGEVRFGGRGDEAVFQYAKKEDRILITGDRDFLNRRRFPPDKSPGVAVLPSPSQGEDALVNAFAHLINVHGDSHELWYEQTILFAGDDTFSITFRDSASSWKTRRFRFPENGAPMVWTEE